MNSKQNDLQLKTEIFQSKIKGYGITFNSIFVEGSFDPSCTVLWKDVNMVYDLTDSNGNYVRHFDCKRGPVSKSSH